MIKLELLNIIKETTNYQELKSKMLELIPDLTFKDHHDDLIIIANKYKLNNFAITELENECRNIILDKNTLELVLYNYNSIYNNDEADHFKLNNNIDENYHKEILESYEGTIIMIFYHNDKWYISTRKCLDAKKSIWNELSYYDLFCETIHDTFENFTKKLNIDYYYTFLLVHHKNKNIIDYSFKFGKDYKEIIHIMTRQKNTHNEISLDDKKQFNEDIVFKQSVTLDSFDNIITSNKTNKLELPIRTEGTIIKLTHKDTNKVILLKYQNNDYKIINKIKPNYNNLYKILIECYKSDILKDHLSYFPKNTKIKIYDNEKKEHIFDTLGIIDATFKLFTYELYEIFKLLYNIHNCKKKDNDIYTKLPNQYKIILYKLRGFYYENKFNETTKLDSKFKKLKIIDIYKFLKNYDLNNLIKLFLARNEILEINEISIIINNYDNDICKMVDIFIYNIKN
tara:strand:+ start:3786 stop:5150 length:1365 start_codon:yes stop_codon:yes gene_type:complete